MKRAVVRADLRLLEMVLKFPAGVRIVRVVEDPHEHPELVTLVVAGEGLPEEFEANLGQRALEAEYTISEHEPAGWFTVRAG